MRACAWKVCLQARACPGSRPYDGIIVGVSRSSQTPEENKLLGNKVKQRLPFLCLCCFCLPLPLLLLEVNCLEASDEKNSRDPIYRLSFTHSLPSTFSKCAPYNYQTFLQAFFCTKMKEKGKKAATLVH